MTRYRNWTCLAAGLVLCGTVSAQELDPAQGIEPVEIAADGRLVVRNGEEMFSCEILASDGSARLANCVALSPAEVALEALSETDWQGRIREVLVASDCKLSALNAVADVIEREALSRGIPREDVDEARGRLGTRVDAAIDGMIRAGQLTMRDGEFALDACD